MRKDSILELIEEAKDTYQIILNHKKISKPKVKSILEHLRSCLEYAVQDINLRLSKPQSKDRLYFPYGKTLEKFEEVADKKLPLLKIELPKIYEKIIELHSFKEDDSWLKTLCDLTNHTKHDNSIQIAHDSEVVKSISVFSGGMGLIQAGSGTKATWSGNTINGKTTDDFILDQDKLMITKKGEVSVDFKITKDRKILVGVGELDLLPFLDNAIQCIENFIEHLYKKI